MILVDPDDLAAHPTRDLAQLAFLVGGGLIKGGDSQIENRSAHGCSSLRGPRGQTTKIRANNQSIFNTQKWASKIARFLRFLARAFRGFFRTPGIGMVSPSAARP